MKKIILFTGTCRMLIMSGPVALDQQGKLVGKGDVGKQAEQVFTNIKNIVENAGGTMNEVVKISIYLTDLSQLQTFRDVRDRFINVSKPPASTLDGLLAIFRSRSSRLAARSFFKTTLA